MKFKTDENLGTSCVDLLTAAGHDVATVIAQDLAGAEDRDVIQACRQEGRAIITLDLDFSNSLIFRPSDYPGIVVLRLPKRPSHQDLTDTINTVIEALRREPLHGKLWSVERGRVRIYQEPDEDI